MKRLNRKGYLTIEIILASVTAVVIAFFLIDLTMKLVDTTDNAYIDTVLITDKALIMKNIKENLENDMSSYNGIGKVECASNTCEIYFDKSYSRSMQLITRKLVVENNTVKYTDYDDNIIYEKKIDSILSNISLTSTNNNGYYNFKISGENIFIKENYDINIIINNNSY